MSKKELKGNALLLISAMLWGLSFTVQDQVAEYVGPFTVNALRSLIGAFVLIPIMLIMSKRSKKNNPEPKKVDKKILLKAGIICGLSSCVALNFQQLGVELYPAEAAVSGRTGFITALYVVLVPIFGLFFHNRPSLNTLLSVVLSIIGMYFLCLSKGLAHIYIADIVIFFSAVAYAVQIMCVDRFAQYLEGPELSFIQFFISGIISLVLMLSFEKVDMGNFIIALKYLVYLGVFSCAVADTLQIISQKLTRNPTVSSILMSLESVFALIGGALILNEVFAPRELIGCCLMFCAIILSQLPKNLLLKKGKNKDGV